MGVFAYVFSPVEGRDFTAFRSQLGIVATAFARTYQQLGLIAPGSPAGAGIRATLKAAAAGWRAKWGADLAAGWNAERGEGLTGRLGGLWLAVIAGRHEIVKDSTAVAVGWAMWLTFVAIMGAIDIHLAVERFTPSQEEIFARLGLR